MPTTEWLNKYESVKEKLTCKDDLEAHFTEKVITTPWSPWVWAPTG